MIWKKLGKPWLRFINTECLRVKGLYKRCICEQQHKFCNCRHEFLTYKLTSDDSKGFWKGI